MSGVRSPYARGDWYDGLRLDPKIDNVISEWDEKRHTAPSFENSGWGEPIFKAPKFGYLVAATGLTHLGILARRTLSSRKALMPECKILSI
jgi:hypothetical protein